MSHAVTLIPGDGIGPEVTEAAVRVIEAAGVEIEWHRVEAGGEVMARYGTPLPDHVLEQIRKDTVALKGPLTTPVGEGFKSVNVSLRQTLKLFASLRPVKTIPGVKSRYEDVDLVVVRENTEDLYSGIEHLVVPGVAESIKIITADAVNRIAKFAFEYARREGRKKITSVHKANIMKISDGLFLECCRCVRRDYPEIEYDEKIVDNVAMQLVRDPTQFDVMLMENLYGDIMSDLCAGLVGGLGVVPGANLGEDYFVFEAVHGSAPDIAGRNLANPTAVILSSVLMLRHLEERAAADRIEGAVLRVLKEGKVRTG
ncbi:MAG: isocitrate/isopropylmalate dehydrogenase family protein, partial [Armatimonadetes bacterium]|nr:isocitrate/isopropylmalate dehydrogenase family protein [Armatimonadota bacterium]